jgi:hypothetical protein
MFLLQEAAKKDQSKFAPWIAVMPVNFKNLPMFWSKEEVGMLHGSIAISRIEGKRKDLKEEWSQVKNV